MSPQTALAFDDTKNAFASKSNFELLRSWLIFKVCAIGPVVRHCDTLYNISLKILGGKLTHGIMRHALFNHFCAGETSKDIVPKMNRLKGFGVGGILDYAAEAKEEAAVTGAAATPDMSVYSGEAVCDANAEIFLEAIRAVRDATPDGFAAVKLSGLGDPKLLERMSSCLVQMTCLFQRMSDGSAQTEALQKPYYCVDRTFEFDVETFSQGWKKFFAVRDDEHLREIFDDMAAGRGGKISFEEWSEGIRLSNINEIARSCLNKGPMYQAALNEEELQLYNNLIGRVQKIMDLAQEMGVRVMVDAEWTDIQPAIDHLVVFLQRKYNSGDRPIVFQTYQTYLKGMHNSVLRDLRRSQREGYHFGGKVVRGAYMVSEREKARVRGLESPICETYEATEANYHSCIDSILEHNPGSTSSEGANAEAEIVVASHCKDSIEHTVRRMGELGRQPDRVYFGQLLGMADHLTFTLAGSGYKAYKYVPYGPIDEVVPYLIRRTQENSAILGSPAVQEERGMVQQELRRRLALL